MATHHLRRHDFARKAAPFREDPKELRTLIKVIGGVCVLYYLLFTSGWISLHPDLDDLTRATLSAERIDATAAQSSN